MSKNSHPKETGSAGFSASAESDAVVLGDSKPTINRQETAGTNSPVLAGFKNSGTINISTPAASPPQEGTKMGTLGVAAAIATILGTIIAATVAWQSSSSENKPAAPAPAVMEQNGAKLNLKTEGPNSPIINNNSGSVNITTPPVAAPKGDSKP